VHQVNTRRALFKKLQERCKRFKMCPFCGAAQGARLQTPRALWRYRCAERRCRVQAL